MIRRGFWLVAGATLGVSGYRRVSRLAQSLFPAGPAEPGTAAGRQVPAAVRAVARRPPLLTGRSVLAGAARAGRSAARGAAFARDVRDGMAEYLDHQRSDQPGPDQAGSDQPGGGRRTLESQRGQRATGRQRRSAAP